jgi:hypothetical protein
VRLTHGHEERVVLVEESRVGRQVGLEEGAGRFVRGLARQQRVPGQDSPRVRVGDEDRPVRRVEENGIGGLRPDPGHGQEGPAERPEGRAAQALEAAVETLDQPAGERAQATRLEAIRPRRAHRLPEVVLAGGDQAGRTQQPARPQAADRARRVPPRRELHQDRPRGDLVRGPAGPPALGTEAMLEGDVEAQQPCLQRIGRRSWDPPPPRAAEPR